MDLSNPAQIKNLMRRCLRLQLAPEPTRMERLRAFEHFAHRCAYCGDDLRGGGDLDHLVSAAIGGSNHISNRVPSCRNCNQKEKLGNPWLEFLRRKCCGDESLFLDRRRMIEQWRGQCGPVAVIPDEALRVLAEEARRVTSEFDLACSRIRGLRT